MPRPISVRHTFLYSLFAVTAASAQSARSNEIAEWDSWRTTRLRNIVEPGRPLSYTGIYWLSEGSTTIGAGTSNTIELQGQKVGDRIGVLVRSGDVVRFDVRDTTAVTIDRAHIASAVLRSDMDARPTKVFAGSAGFQVVQRGASIGVRTWDANSKTLRAFKGLEYFDYQPAWRIAGMLERRTPPVRLAVMTEAGIAEEYVVAGSVHVSVDGKRYAFTAYDAGPSRLFITFSDASSGDETYGFRFLFASVSVSGSVTLDFNYAYNPDCAFSAFTLCPLPPPENRIKARILAGERVYKREP